jgi:hypothetical protein
MCRRASRTRNRSQNKRKWVAHPDSSHAVPPTKNVATDTENITPPTSEIFCHGKNRTASYLVCTFCFVSQQMSVSERDSEPHGVNVFEIDAAWNGNYSRFAQGDADYNCGTDTEQMRKDAKWHIVRVTEQHSLFGRCRAVQEWEARLMVELMTRGQLANFLRLSIIEGTPIDNIAPPRRSERVRRAPSRFE